MADLEDTGCEALLKALTSDSHEVREHAAMEAKGTCRDDEPILALILDLSNVYWADAVRAYAGALPWRLGRGGPPEARFLEKAHALCMRFDSANPRLNARLTYTLGRLFGHDALAAVRLTQGDSSGEAAGWVDFIERGAGIPPAEGVGVLIEALADEHDGVQLWAAERLSRCVQQTPELLTAVLKSGPPRIRAWSAVILGLAGDERAEPQLVKNLLEPHFHRVLKANTLAALERIPCSEERGPRLEAGFYHPDQSVRSWCAVALGRSATSNASRALPELLRMLNGEAAPVDTGRIAAALTAIDQQYAQDPRVIAWEDDFDDSEGYF